MLDAEKIRGDFPLLSRRENGKAIAYLDNAATTQKPFQVLAAMDEYYRNSNANPHRGNYGLVEEATESYEAARKKVASFIGARPCEIIFTKNCTESLNLASTTLCEAAGNGSRVLLTQMEHHSNIVPWQIQAKRRGLALDYVKIGGSFRLCVSDLEGKLAKGPLAFSFAHCSNALGTINDAKALCRKAKAAGAISCVDGAQSAPNMPLDVKEIGCDMYAFSGHKMLGPAGIGVLYVRQSLAEKLPPFMGGGDMIRSVSFGGASYNEPPYKFEAGTQNVAGAVGLAAATDYLQKIGMGRIAAHERGLAKYFRDELSQIAGARFFGPAGESGIVSFNIGKIHAHDLGQFANSDGVCIRAGHHCAQPLMRLLGESATARASFYLYNAQEEADRLVSSMKKAAARLG